MDDTISLNQNTFVGGRLVLEASLVANESVKFMGRAKKEGLVLKLDFERAYDQVNWGFLDFTVAH